MKIKSYFIAMNGIKGVCKSPAIRGYDANENSSSPLVYLLKPKWISEKSFKKILSSLSINLSQNIEID